MMARETWLLLDVSSLAYKHHYARGYNLEEPETMVYGLFNDVKMLQELYNTKNVAFCFDGGYEHRLKIYPEYKQNRKRALESMSEEDLEYRRQLRKQVHLMRTQYLPEIGSKNILHQSLYEADDVIAWVTKNLGENRDFIIVSSDHDLYQLLDKNCVVWSPLRRRPTTYESFQKEFGISPKIWWKVRAISGCSSDNIVGVYGVGQIFAIRYLNGQLSEDSPKYKSIQDSAEVIKRNKLLTRLPMEGCGPFELIPDDVTEKKWEELLARIGFEPVIKRHKTRTRTRRETV